MKPTKIYTFTIGAGQGYQLLVAGDYFKILSATGTLRVDSQDGVFLDGISGGNGMEDTPFKKLVFTDTSGASNTVRVVIGDEKFIDSSLGNLTVAGTVAISGGTIDVNSTKAPRAAFTMTAPTINTASTAMLGANAARQHLCIQNQHGSLDIWVNVAGAAAVAGPPSVKIAAGGSWSPEVAPTGAVAGIALAANALVAVVEG